MATHIKLNSGYNFPIVGLGTWQLEADDVPNAVTTAIEVGYRHFDCAHIYRNEEEIGKALKEVIDVKKLVKREELFITSKLWSNKHRKEHVKPALKESLKKLKLNYLDLYLIHWPLSFKAGDDDAPADASGNLIYDNVHYTETWEALEECVKEGLVHSIGLSNFNSAQIKDILEHSNIKPAVLQVEIHPYLQNNKLVEFSQAHGITVTSYSSFTSPTRPWLNKDKPVASIFDEAVLKDVAVVHNKTPAQVILRWLMQRNVSVIPKSSNPERIRKNFQVFDFVLSKDEMDQIGKLDRNLRVVIPEEGENMFWNVKDPYYPFNIEF